MMEIALILIAPFLFQARMLLECPIIRCVFLLVRRRQSSELRSGYLVKAQRRLDDLPVIQRTAPAWPYRRPPPVEVAYLLPCPSMKGTVVPIDVLIGMFLFHEIDQ